MKRALIFILVLLAMGSAYAEITVEVINHNADVQSTTSHLKVCSCGTTTDIVRIKNIGDLAATYLISLETESDWFILSKYNIYLEPGQLEDVPIFITAPCKSVATESYTVHVASEYGRYRSVEKSVQAGVCENIAAWVDPEALTVQPCGSAPVDIHITNVGTFDETYAVEGVGEIELAPGDSGTLETAYTATCEEWGEKTIPITIRSERNEQTVQREVRVTVPRAYDYGVSAEGGGAACLGEPVQVPVTVRNAENRANTLVIGAEGVAEQQLYLQPGAERTVRLQYTPSAVGEQTFTVNARGLNGTIEKSASVRFAVEDCYSFTLEAPQQVDVCAGELQVPFTLVGTGNRRHTLAYEVQSDMPTELDSREGASISPGQQLTKTITATVPDMDGQHYVTLLVNSTAQSSQATTLVNGYSTETCYRVETQDHRFTVFTDAEVLPVVITHTGVQPALYTVSYNGTFLQAIEQNITLMPGQQGVLHFNVTNVTDYELGDYVDRLTLTSNGVDYITDFKITLAEKGFWELFKDAFYYNGAFAVCSIISVIALLLLLAALILVLGIVFGKVYYENPLWISKETAGIVGSILLIMLLVMMIFSGLSIPRTYERPVGPSNASALSFEIGQADTLTLELDDYFSDPDNDALTYSANQPGNLRVRLQDGTALIEPRNGFSGTETLVFTAQDAQGGITDSDLVTVTVVPYKPVTFLEYWQYGCWFFTALLLFLAVALALLAVFLGERRKGTPSSGQLVLYRRPRTHIVRGGAHDLVEQADPTIQPLPPGTNLGTIVNAEKIVINQGKKDELWIASEDGTKFHRMTCPVIKNMPAEKRIVFDSREEALKTGYTPCKTCSSHE